MGVIFKYLVRLLLSTASNDVDNLERAQYYDDELVQKDEGCLSFQIVIIRKNWGKGQMLKRFKGGAENRSGGPQKVEEGGEQEILGGIIALRRIVPG